MTNPRNHILRATSTSLPCAAGLALALLALCGCKKEPPPPPPPPPPPVVRAPEPLRIESILTDPRVQFPQQLAPADEALARSVVSFATALVKGDHAALGSLLDAPARGLLDMQVRSGEFSLATSALTAVRVIRLDSKGDTADIGLAIQGAPGPGAAYLTGWRAKQLDGKWVFGGMPVLARSASVASDLDGADLVPPAPKEEPKPAAVKPDKPAETPAAPAVAPPADPKAKPPL